METEQAGAAPPSTDPAGLETLAMLPALHRAFEESGRDPDDADVSVMLPFVDHATLDRYASAGIARLILPLPSA